MNGTGITQGQAAMGTSAAVYKPVERYFVRRAGFLKLRYDIVKATDDWKYPEESRISRIPRIRVIRNNFLFVLHKIKLSFGWHPDYGNIAALNETVIHKTYRKKKHEIYWCHTILSVG